MRRAVTLVEILIVVAMLGVLASLSMISISDTVIRARMVADADEIDDILRRARLLARMERRCVLVVTDQNRIDIIPLGHNGAPPPDCSESEQLAGRATSRTLMQGISLSQSAVMFDRAGGALQPFDLVVTLTPPGAPTRVFIIRVLAGSGAISRVG